MAEEKRLSGRVALVTGAAKRLGRAVALRLAEEGAELAVHYRRSANEAREVVGEAEKRGRHAASFSAELTSVPAIQKLFDDVAHHFGRLDILVNSAANFLETKFGETTESRWDSSLDTNLKAPFFAHKPPLLILSVQAVESSSIFRTLGDCWGGASIFLIRFRRRESS